MAYKIQTLNKISSGGLAGFSRGAYKIASDVRSPDAILVRSFDMHALNLPISVKAVARAGAGVNNIPVAELTEQGIVVFNTPGANANAVKELVLLSLLASGRDIVHASRWVETLRNEGAAIPKLAEDGKSRFVGPELAGKTLGVIGLGAIGVLVANTAMSMGMSVIGYDPFISINGAWSLKSDVIRAENINTLLSQSDYITIHIPQTDATKGLINAESIESMKTGVRLINLAREQLAVTEDVLCAINAGKIAFYITDFANAQMLGHDKIVCLPHMGASTPEAEENCAKMAVSQLKDFLESGAIYNSVNFPVCKIDGAIPEIGGRLCVANKNIPNMIGQITTVLADARLNIAAMVNQNRKDYAYNLIDVENDVAPDVLDRIVSIDGVLRMRYIGGSKNV